MPDSAFLASISHWAMVSPDAVALVILTDDGSISAELTYGALEQAARSAAGAVAAAGACGRPVLLFAEPTTQFTVALLACFYAGAIPTPVPPSRRPPAVARLGSILTDAEIRYAIVAGPSSAGLAADYDVLTLIEPGDRHDAPERSPAPGDVALLQYTSGSTAAPKGVQVTHANLAANLAMLRSAFAVDETSRILSWLPLHHDMGLIGQLLLALTTGATCHLMAPSTFVQRPLRWLQAIDRHRITISGAPNFAYALCARRLEAKPFERLDLSGWRVAFCGAEPVRRVVLDRFLEAVGAHGFDPRALLPCYGLAEATVYVSGGPAGTGMVTLPPDATDAKPGIDLVGCGRIGDDIAIVNPDTHRMVEDGEVGEIWVAGNHVAAGYRGDPAEDTFAAMAIGDKTRPFLRTGDLGLVVDAQLYIKGRLKALVIHRGVKHHPEDIEATIGTSDPLLIGMAAVFSVDIDGEEKVMAAVEAPRARISPDILSPIIARCIATVAEAHGVRLDNIILVPLHSLPRTTSGKIQRQLCADQYRIGKLRTASAGSD